MAVSALPSTQSAVKVTGSSTVSLTTGVPLPTLKPSDVLVRVASVSINHVDGKSADMSPSPGATSGVDFAGVVVGLGQDVKSDNWRTNNQMKPVNVGDRVFGGVFGNNPLRHDNGSFAEYVAVPARLIWHIPEEMDFATASTIGATLATVGLALFQYLQVPMPSSPVGESDAAPGAKPRLALVYGGGTATGAMAIQVLKVAGFTPITTCSAGSAPRALRLGAEATFDYKSPTCGADLREYTDDSLEFALDCITDTASMNICYEALGSAGGRYVALDAFPLRGHTRRSVVPEWVCTYTQFGEPVDWAPPYNLDARPKDLEVAEAWYVVAQQLVDQGRIEPYPKEDRKGGLAAVGEGMRAVWKGEIYGKKLAYAVAEC